MRGRMTMRATIERDQAAPDEWGGTGAADWQPHLAGVPCWAWVVGGGAGGGGRVLAEGDRTVVIEDRRVGVPHGTDVKVGDRIATITDRLGAELYDGPMRIDAVLRRVTHLELTVDELS